MTPEEQINQLRQELQEFKDIYQRNRFSSLEIKDKDTKFIAKIGLSVEPVGQQNHIANPTDAPADYNQAIAQNWVDTQKSILTALETFGFNKTS